MHLPEGLGLYWRDNDCVQLGLSPERSAIFPGLYPREIPLFNLLRSPCTKEDVELWARTNKVDRGRAKKIWEDVDQTGLAVGDTLPGTVARGEYAAATRAGTAVPTASAKFSIEVHGAGLVGTFLIRALNLYGFGSITVDDSHPVTDSVAYWLGVDTFGEPLDVTLRSRLSPGRTPPEDTIVVSVSSRVYLHHIARTCLAESVPYLPIVVGETAIQIGPFVTGSPCIECVESHRTAADATWPLLTAQAGRLPILEADTASALQAASWAISELLYYVSNPELEPRLSHSILHIPPPPLWPYVEDVTVFDECGCVAV